MRKTLLTLALMAAPLATPLPALADKLADLKAQGFARIAIANEPPFTAVAADGKVSGAAPDVAREIFKRLGVPDVVASISELRGLRFLSLRCFPFCAIHSLSTALVLQNVK